MLTPQTKAPITIPSLRNINLLRRWKLLTSKTGWGPGNCGWAAPYCSCNAQPWRWLTLKVNSTRLPTSLVVAMADSPITVPLNSVCTNGFALDSIRDNKDYMLEVKRDVTFSDSCSVTFLCSFLFILWVRRKSGLHGEEGVNGVFNQQGHRHRLQVTLLTKTDKKSLISRALQTTI